MMDKINYKIINFSIIFFIIFLFINTFDFWTLLIKNIYKIISPIFISFIIAYSIFPLVKMLRKQIKNNTWTIIIILLVFFILIFILLYLSIPMLVNQLILLSKQIIPFIDKFFDKLSLINISFVKDLLTNNINELIYKLSSSPIKIVIESVSFFTNFIIILILSICFLFNMENIKEFIKKLIRNKKIISVLKEIDQSLNNYLNGLFIIIFVEIIEYTIIYFLVGHPNFLLLGILAGITTIIPYFGNLFTNILALITAASISSKLFIICAIIVIILPIIDSYIIDPKIYHKTTKLSPIKIIISIIISSTIFGIFGIIIAIPFYLCVEIIIKNYFNLKLCK